LKPACSKCRSPVRASPTPSSCMTTNEMHATPCRNGLHTAFFRVAEVPSWRAPIGRPCSFPPGDRRPTPPGAEAVCKAHRPVQAPQIPW
jgi:hypothetical protein